MTLSEFNKLSKQKVKPLTSSRIDLKESKGKHHYHNRQLKVVSLGYIFEPDV